MKRLHLPLFICFVFLLGACTTTRPTVPNPTAPPDKSINAVEILQRSQVPFDWFSGTADGRIEWEGDTYTAKINVRIQKDKVVWVVISKLGFEVGRMLVRPDSAFFINRLERTWSAYETVVFLKKSNLPADFDLFQRVFTGGAYIPPGYTDIKWENDQVLISSPTVQGHYWFSGDVLYKSVNIDPAQHEWTAGYADYRATNTGKNFPFTRTNALLSNGESHVFDLQYTEVTMDVPQEFPFSIPSNYEKE